MSHRRPPQSRAVARGGAAAALTLALLAAFPLRSEAQDTPEQDAPKTLTLTLDGKSIVASGATPQGSVLFFGMSRSYDAMVPIVSRDEEVLGDDDGDGIVQWEPHVRFSDTSLWLAVDLASGTFAIGTPDPQNVRQLPLPATALRRDVTGRLDRLAGDRPYLEVLLVRSGAGGWRVSANDGSRTDDDGDTDGATLVALDQLEAIGTTPATPPEELLSGDLLLLVDRRTLEFYTLKLAG